MDSRIESSLKTLGFTDCRSLNELNIMALKQDTTVEKIIEKKYKQQALIVHPDRNTNPNANEAMQNLQNDYQYLMNEVSIKSDSSSKTELTRFNEKLSKFKDCENFINLLPRKIEVYGTSSQTNARAIVLSLATLLNKNIEIHYYYDADKPKIAPIAFYSALVQIAINIIDPLILLNEAREEGSGLVLPKIENIAGKYKFAMGDNEYISRFREDIEIQTLRTWCDLFGFKWYFHGKVIEFNEDIDVFKYVGSLGTVPGHLVANPIEEIQFLPDTTVVLPLKETLSITNTNSASTTTNQEIFALLHDGIISKEPNLTKYNLTNLLSAHEPLSQIQSLGELYSYIITNVSTNYSHVKSNKLYLWESSGNDIKNHHITLLKTKLKEIVSTQKNPDSLRDAIEQENVKNLINYSVTENRVIERNEKATRTREFVNNFIPEQTSLLEYKK